MIENRDQLVFGAMQELGQSAGRKILLEELKKMHDLVYAKLLEVREDQDKPTLTADQLYKRELVYLKYLMELPTSLVKTTTTYFQDRSKEL